MAIALVTNYLTAYRVPLYQRLAERYAIEVLCHGGGDRYVPAWFADLDAQLDAAPFAARRLGGAREALRLGRDYDAIIAPFAGGGILPAAYAGARRYHRPFVLWASVWAQPRSVRHAIALPAIRHIYRNADSVIAYGEHAKRFVSGIRGRDSDIFVAPQSVEASLFGRDVAPEEIRGFRQRHELHGPLALYTGRLVSEKGVAVLLDAWSQVEGDATLVMIGDGPFAERAQRTPRVRFLGPLPRDDLPIAYAAARMAVLPSIPTPLFREPWGLVCNEAMHQATPVIATTAVGAVAGGLVRDGETGLVVPPGDAPALRRAIDRLLADAPLRSTIGIAAKQAVAAYTYDAMTEGFDAAIATAFRAAGTRGSRRRD